MTDTAAEPRWTADDTVVVEEFTFLTSDQSDVYHDVTSGEFRFLLVKDPETLRQNTTLFRSLGVRNIVEAGIWQGGSVVYWNLVLAPQRQLAFDLYDRSVDALEHFCAGSRAIGNLDVRYGVDQADRTAVLSAVEQTFGGEPLDLVLDDASHLYPESRATFETLFPLLRPGGMYVIEDWAWAHTTVQTSDTRKFRDRPALSNLVVEAMLLCGSREDIVSEVKIYHSFATVTRGPTPVAEPFRISEHSFNRGLPYRPLL